MRAQRRNYRVKARAAERQLLRCGNADVDPFAQTYISRSPSGVTDHVGGRVDAESMNVRTTPRDLDEEVTRPSADIEHSPARRDACRHLLRDASIEPAQRDAGDPVEQGRVVTDKHLVVAGMVRGVTVPGHCQRARLDAGLTCADSRS